MVVFKSYFLSDNPLFINLQNSTDNLSCVKRKCRCNFVITSFVQIQSCSISCL